MFKIQQVTKEQIHLYKQQVEQKLALEMIEFILLQVQELLQ